MDWEAKPPGGEIHNYTAIFKSKNQIQAPYLPMQFTDHCE